MPCIPDSIRIPALGDRQEEVIKPIEAASIDDIAFAQLALQAKPPANDLIEGFTLDEQTGGINGTAASKTLGLGYGDARFAKGLEVRDTTQVAWPLSVPAEFSATFALRFDELLEEPQVYLVWSGGSGALSLGYDPTIGIYYLEDHLGNRVELTLARMGVDLRWGGDWDSDTEVRDNSFDDLVHFEIVE